MGRKKRQIELTLEQKRRSDELDLSIREANYKNCNCCGLLVQSPYAMEYNSKWYFGHKRCMGKPMIDKLNGKPEQIKMDLGV